MLYQHSNNIDARSSCSLQAWFMLMSGTHAVKELALPGGQQARSRCRSLSFLGLMEVSAHQKRSHWAPCDGQLPAAGPAGWCWLAGAC